jgi:hypothetical protein
VIKPFESHLFVSPLLYRQSHRLRSWRIPQKTPLVRYRRNSIRNHPFVSANPEP